MKTLKSVSLELISNSIELCLLATERNEIKKQFETESNEELRNRLDDHYKRTEKRIKELLSFTKNHKFSLTAIRNQIATELADRLKREQLSIGISEICQRHYRPRD